ncbi:tyrosine-type recombinase/integrase [Vagococcus carniphilus]|uniref:tyrosine-type recombinase/integrase n=1 Tax=Vagococcus carniphilus TaxID=218144 RepID=UPI003BAB31AD
MARRGENIYKRKDGRWEGRYIKGRKQDGSIKFGYLYSHSYQDLRKKLYEEKLLNADVNFNFKYHSNSISAEKWITYWLTKQKENVRYNTFKSYNSMVKNHIYPHFSSYLLNEINQENIQVWINTLNKTLKPSSVNVAISVFSICLNDAILEGYLTKNPTKGVYLLKDDIKVVKAFSKIEQEKIENQIFLNECNFKKYYPFYLSLYTGMRVGELTGLKWTDINWEEGYLVIQRSIQRVKTDDGQSQLVETKTKTANSQRVIPLSDTTLYWLIKWKEINYKDSDYVISGRYGKPMEPRNLRYHFKILKEISDVQDLPIHSLRHSFATRCIESNASVATVSDLMGHRSIKMTLDTYTSSFFGEKQKVINLLSNDKNLHQFG